MTRNWLRNVAANLTTQPTRRRVRRLVSPTSAAVQTLEPRIMLAAPRLSPTSQTLTYTLAENIGVDTGVTGTGTGATSNPYTDSVTGTTVSNTSNGHYVGSFTVDAGGDAGENVTSAVVQNFTTNSPFRTEVVSNEVRIYVNNFEWIDYERNPTLTFGVVLTDNHAPTPETATVNVTVNLISRNDIPYISTDGGVDGGRDFRDFNIVENAPPGTILDGSSGNGSVIIARTAIQHSVNANLYVGTNVDPHDPSRNAGDNGRIDVTGVIDNDNGILDNQFGSDGVGSLRYQIVRATTSTQTPGMLGSTNEVQLINRDPSLTDGQFILAFSSDRTVSTITNGVNPSINEVQQIDFGGTTSGFYTLTFTTNGSPSNSYTTSPIFYTATAAEIQAELEKLPGVGLGNIQVRDLVNVVQTTKGGPGQNEVQTLNLTSPPQSGNFRLAFNGQTTGAIGASATAAQVQAALESLSSIGAGNVSVTGANGGPYAVTFQGTLANLDVNAIQSVGGFTVNYQGALSGANQNQLAMTSYTTPISYTASAATIQSRLAALPTIGTGNVTVALNGTTGWQVTYGGALGLQDVNQLRVVNLSDLVEVSNDRPTLGRVSLAPAAASYLIGSRNDSANGLNSGFEFLRDYFDLAQGPANGSASFLALVRVFDQSSFDPLTNTNIAPPPFIPTLSYSEYIRINVTDASEAAPVVQDEVYTINEFAPNSGTTNGLIVGKLNDFANVTVQTSVAPTSGVNEQQVVTATITGATNPGSFVLSFKGQKTSRIVQTDNAATVKAKLEALSTIGAGNVLVTGGSPDPISKTNTWTVTFVGTLAATDVPQLVVFNGVSDAEQPSEIFRYSIVAGNSNGAFAINQTTGEITVNNASLLNYEVTPTYRLVVRVTDTSAGGSGQSLSTDVAVDINLVDVNEQTTIPAGQQLFVEEGSAVGTQLGSFSVSDPDRDPPRDYQYIIENGNLIDPLTGQPTFIINPDTGVISVNSAGLLDSSTQPFFDIGVRVVDRGDLATSGSGTIRIYVVDVNTAPPILNDVSFTINENAPNLSVVGQLIGQTSEPNQTLSYTILSGNTNSAFSLDSTTGFLTVANSTALNFEVVQQFELLVQVSDSASAALFDTAIVTVFLNDRNEQVDITNAGTPFSVAENALLGAVVGTVNATDLDDTAVRTQGRIFSIVAGNAGGAFAINASTGQITVANPTALNFETKSTYKLAVQVTDIPSVGQSNPATSDIDVNIDINIVDANDAPVLNDQTLPNVIEHRLAGTVVGTVVASDVDSPAQALTYSIIGGNTNGAFAINAATGQVTIANPAAVDYTESPVFNLTVQVTDNGSPALSDTGVVTINLSDANPPLIANQTFSLPELSAAGTVVSVNGMGNSVLTPGTGTTPLTFNIIGGNTGNTFRITSAGVLEVNNPALLDFDTNPTFTLQVQVNDSSNPQLVDVGTITINLTDVNEAPVINAQTLTVAESSPNGTIVGTVVATDPDAGQTLTYEIAAGNESGAFAINTTTGQITVANGSLLDLETLPTYSLTVKVTDNGLPTNLSSTGTVTINLTDANDPPVVNDQNFSVAENSAAGTVVGTVASSDPDVGQGRTYSITGGNTGTTFAINATTGQITVASSTLLDFEATPTFTLTVQVTDAGTPSLSDTATITISLTNANDAPVVTPGQTFSIPELSANGTVVGTVASTDQDAGQTRTYSILGGNTGGAFAINATTGQLTVANSAVLDYITTPTFTLSIQVLDNGVPALTGTGTVTVNLSDANNPPVVPPKTFSIAENSAAGTLVGTVTATDVDAGQTRTFAILTGNTGGAFAIDPITGQITVANPAVLDYETTTSFTLTVSATDNGVPPQAGTGTVTINLLDVNDPPTINPQVFTLPENSPAGTAVGSVVAGDADSGQTRTYSITSGNVGNAFSINSQTGVISVVAPAALDFETNPVFNLIVQVADSGTPRQTASATVTINLTNVNEVPRFTPVQQSFSIAENSAAGVAVGTVAVVDVDAGQTKSFSILSGNTNNAFSINATTGAITVNNPAALNFEGVNSYNLTIQVSDNGSPALTATGQVQINVTNANDTPTVNPVSLTVNSTATNGTLVGSVTASDEDLGQIRTFAIVSGNTGNAFAVNPLNGQITVANAGALSSNSSFSLVISATDNGVPAKTGTGIVTITVRGNAAPVVTNSNFAVRTPARRGAAVGKVIASDVDAGQTLRYAITGGNTFAAFSINALTGQITVNRLIFRPQTFNLTVTVTDNGTPARSSTGTITIFANSTGVLPTNVAASAGTSQSSGSSNNGSSSTASPPVVTAPVVTTPVSTVKKTSFQAWWESKLN